MLASIPLYLGSFLACLSSLAHVARHCFYSYCCKILFCLTFSLWNMNWPASREKESHPGKILNHLTTRKLPASAPRSGCSCAVKRRGLAPLLLFLSHCPVPWPASSLCSPRVWGVSGHETSSCLQGPTWEEAARLCIYRCVGWI